MVLKLEGSNTCILRSDAQSRGIQHPVAVGNLKLRKTESWICRYYCIRSGSECTKLPSSTYLSSFPPSSAVVIELRGSRSNNNSRSTPQTGGVFEEYSDINSQNTPQTGRVFPKYSDILRSKNSIVGRRMDLVKIMQNRSMEGFKSLMWHHKIRKINGRHEERKRIVLGGMLGMIDGKD